MSNHPQPTTADADTSPSNPVTKNPSEAATASSHTPSKPSPGDQKIPQKQVSEDQANTWAQGRGIHGAPPGEEAKGLTEEDVGRHNENEGAIDGTPAEGRVADAVAGRDGGSGKGALSGGGGEQPDLASGLDKKKAEQAEAREAMKKQRAENMAVGGAAGQQGGPAVPVP